ncbi:MULTISPECIES: PTS lactose/cellobiose transporter subunit IIA [unclassified Clostridium]|uniref:PTS lactose/cellobiose transporter subunit IIA n=1 Tax=unclassified Clostridium TaxID=2614128 RepID=UPI001EEDC69E|nr:MULTISPECIES: PTS lactose/cellobiose transporter subunit IIA [unclassified Clostridium]
MAKFDTEMIAMNIIANSGEARSLAFRALDEAKKGNYDEAEILMKSSKDSALEAHKVQTELLVSEADGEKADINVLLIHSQDHLMTSILAQELIKEIIILHEESRR